MSAAETAVVTKTNGNGEGHHPAPALPGEAPSDFLIRLASNPHVDAQKLEVLSRVYINTIEQQRVWLREDAAERASVAATIAKAAMQAELPVLEKSVDNSQTRSKYADFGMMWEECKPVWTRHGFSVSYQSALTEAGLVRVSLLLDHAEAGATMRHREIYEAPDAPPDTTGFKGTVNKTIPQGNQSTTTYLQRGLLCRALGIAMRGEDNDGNDGAADTGYRPHTQSTAMRQEVRRGPAEPPPTRPGNGQRSWVDTALDDLGTIPPGWQWAKALKEWVAKAPSTEDIDELAVVVKAVVDQAPAPSQVEIKSAFMLARKRLQPPGFDHRLIEADGTDHTGEFFTDPLIWAHAFSTLWEEAFPLDRENLAHHNSEALEEARQHPQAAKVIGPLLRMEREQTGGESGSTDSPGESPGNSPWATTVMPPSLSGQPAWTLWPNLIRDELASVPGFDLGEWLEAQRPQFEQAPLEVRLLAANCVIKAFGEAKVPLPAWFTAGASDGASDASDAGPGTAGWAEAKVAEIKALGTDQAARKLFNAILNGDIRPHLKTLRQAAPDAYGRLERAATEKNNSLPVEA